LKTLASLMDTSLAKYAGQLIATSGMQLAHPFAEAFPKPDTMTRFPWLESGKTVGLWYSSKMM
jgi:hypothetical protein